MSSLKRTLIALENGQIFPNPEDFHSRCCELIDSGKSITLTRLTTADTIAENRQRVDGMSFKVIEAWHKVLGEDLTRYYIRTSSQQIIDVTNRVF